MYDEQSKSDATMKNDSSCQAAVSRARLLRKPSHSRHNSSIKQYIDTDRGYPMTVEFGPYTEEWKVNTSCMQVTCLSPMANLVTPVLAACVTTFLTWVHIGAILNELPHRLNVPVCDGLWVGQLLGEAQRNADLCCADVRVGRDNGSAGVIDAFAHHVLPEDTLLLLENLPQRNRRDTHISQLKWCNV